MKLLGIECASLSCSVALCEDDRLIAQSFQNCGLTHSRTLLPMVEDLLQNADTPFSAVEGIAVAHGPGSFTGVRIGVSAAKGLALSRDLPCVGVSTLSAMAHSSRALGGKLCCVMDARREQVYRARFEVADGTVSRLCADDAVSIEALGQEISESPYFLVGDGAALCYNRLRAQCPKLKIAPPELVYPTGYGVCLAALAAFCEGQAVSAEALSVFYLRRPQAERERESRLSAQCQG